MKKVQICGHRGFPEKYPQNTLPSFEGAIAVGCDRIEYDLHWTADHKLAVCHNATIDETSNGSGAVAEMTLAELRKFDFGIKKGPQFAGTVMPTFSELLDFTNKLKPDLFHLVELKISSPECAEEVLAELFKRGMIGRFTLVSFHLDLLKEMKKRHPQIFIHGNPSCSLKSFDYEEYRVFDSVGIRRDNITPEVVHGFHDVGVQVDAWTVNDGEEFARQFANGVDSVTSNNPEAVINYYRNMAK